MSADTSSLFSWSHQASSGVTSVDVSADGSHILAGTLGKRVLCLDSTGTVLWSTKVGNQAWRVAFSADGQLAVAGTGSTRPWDMKGRGLYAFDGKGQLCWKQDLGASVWGLAMAPDGRTVAVGTSGREALLFDDKGHLLWRRETPGLGWWAWVWAAALSADGQTVAVGAANKSILVLNRDGKRLGEHRADADVFAVAVSADGHTVAAGSSDQQVYLLNGQGELLWCERLKDKVWTVALSANGQRLVVGAGEKEAHVRTFDRGGRPLWKRYVEGSVSRVAVSVGCEVVAVGTRTGHIHIFDGDGEPLYHDTAPKMIRDLAISTDVRTAVAASEDGRVYCLALPLQLPALRPPDEEPSPAKTEYHIYIEHASGLAIGDHAQVQQHFVAPAQTVQGSWETLIEQVTARLDALSAQLGQGVADLKRGQTALYRQVDQAYRDDLARILIAIQQGRMEQGEMQATLDALRRAMRVLVEQGLPTDAGLQSAIADLTETVESSLRLERKLELSLPLIPLFLDYKIELGVDSEIDLHALWDELRRRARRSKGHASDKRGA